VKEGLDWSMVKRWDDLQLLRLIDELEQTGGSSLQNGLVLMDKAADGRQHIDWSRDVAPFARELILARDAGYLTWRDMGFRNIAPTDPLINPQQWLQEIWELSLTLTGRDRARGRVVERTLPDPSEDDGRPITGMALEEIARAIGDTYTGVQLPRYLRDSGIPEEFVPQFDAQTKWVYVLDVLETMHEGGSAARRTLREFIGGWLAGQHHADPTPEVHRRITVVLGRQGWLVHEGRLVIGEKSNAIPGPRTAVGGDARVAALHEDVRAVAERYLSGGHPEVAIFEAFKAVNNRVKRMTDSQDDGQSLMAHAFTETNPPLLLADLSNQTGRNIQAGYRFLFMGAVQGLRNPDAHEQFAPLDENEALERLAFASMLMRRLDEARLAT
jgi:uncharacterized protein (TIGR02391 family)